MKNPRRSKLPINFHPKSKENPKLPLSPRFDGTPFFPHSPLSSNTKFSFLLESRLPRIYHNHAALVSSQSFRTVILLALILLPSPLPISSREKVLSISPSFYDDFPVTVLLAIPSASPYICTLIGFALAAPSLSALSTPFRPSHKYV